MAFFECVANNGTAQTLHLWAVRGGRVRLIDLKCKSIKYVSNAYSPTCSYQKAGESSNTFTVGTTVEVSSTVTIAMDASPSLNSEAYFEIVF